MCAHVWSVCHVGLPERAWNTDDAIDNAACIKCVRACVCARACAYGLCAVSACLREPGTLMMRSIMIDSAARELRRVPESATGLACDSEHGAECDDDDDDPMIMVAETVLISRPQPRAEAGSLTPPH